MPRWSLCHADVTMWGPTDRNRHAASIIVLPLVAQISANRPLDAYLPCLCLQVSLKCLKYPDQSPSFTVTCIKPVSKGSRKEVASIAADAATAEQKAALESQVSNMLPSHILGMCWRNAEGSRACAFLKQMAQLDLSANACMRYKVAKHTF